MSIHGKIVIKVRSIPFDILTNNFKNIMGRDYSSKGILINVLSCMAKYWTLT